MLETFFDTINTQDFCETGFIEILSVKQRKEQGHLNMALRLQMAILSEPGVEMTEYWRLDFKQVQSHWCIHDRSIFCKSIVFYGVISNPSSLW